MRIIIAPYSANLPTGKRNAKNYDRWPELLALLKADGHYLIQLGAGAEARVEGVDQFILNLPLPQIVPVVAECDLFISVDSWLPHFCNTERLGRGIVLFSQSDPQIFGYPHNINLLADRKFLRSHQFAPWYDVEFVSEAFVSPETVLAEVRKLIPDARPAFA